MFFKLNKVKIGEKIVLTDSLNKSVKYEVYEIKEVLPNNIEVLSQETKEEKEITLITCEEGATTRLVVKAVNN